MDLLNYYSLGFPFFFNNLIFSLGDNTFISAENVYISIIILTIKGLQYAYTCAPRVLFPFRKALNIIITITFDGQIFWRNIKLEFWSDEVLIIL